MATNMMDLMEEAVWRNYRNADFGYDEYYTIGKKYAVLDLERLNWQPFILLTV